MAFSFNGFGTTYYGERDFRPDGSFITTEWIILAFVPVIPLGSLRVIRTPQRDTNLVVYRSSKSIVVERLSPHLGQVLATYGFLLLLAACVLTGVKIASHLDSGVGFFTGVAFGVAPFFLMLFLRRRAVRRVAFSREAVLETVQTLQNSNSRESPAQTRRSRSGRYDY